MFCLCFVGQTELWSQTYQCGTISQGPLSGEPKYVDRFGNLYAQADVTADPNALHCHNSGDFDLVFVTENVNGVDYPFSDIEMITICEVFQYLSGLLDVPPTRRARIELSKNPLLSANTYAAASPYFPNQCGLGHSLIHRVFATNAIYPPGTLHGHIEINPAVDFYDEPAMPTASTPGDLVDLYSVVLHEALHLLGFASTVNLSGGPTDGFYTLWDLGLRNTNGEFMIANEPSQTGACCLDYHLNTPAFPNFPDMIWNQNCGDLVFDVPQAPPVNGNYPGQSDVDLMNTLSHLDDGCGDDYVMNYSIVPIANGGVRRVMTPAEVAILCRLGYTVGGNCDAACFVMATRDGPITRRPNQFPWVLPYDQFLQNDVVSADADVRFPSGCLDNSLFSIVNDPVARTVTINFVGNVAEGYYRLCYALTGCDARTCDRGIIQLVVVTNNSNNPNSLAFCDPADCRMVCNGDFEEYFPTDSDFHIQAGMTSWEDNRAFPYIHNISLDVCYMVPSGNQVVGGLSHDKTEEAFVYPLKRPIPPNCTATISFDCAVYNNPPYSNPMLPWRILGLNQVPACPEIRTPDDCGQTVYTDYGCGGLSSVCIRTIPFEELGSTSVIDAYEIMFGEPNYPFNINRGSVRAIDAFPLTPVSFTWTNESSIPINCIMIDYRFPGPSQALIYNYIDNFAVELAPGCLNHVTITPTVQTACIEGTTAIDFEVCLNGPVPTPADVQLTVPINSLFGISYAGGGDFINGSTVITGMTPGQCVTRRLMLNLPGSLFNGQVLNFEILTAITGACWDNQGNNMFQVTADNCCALPLAADFTFQIDCRAVTFQSTPNAAHVTHAWDFDGDGSIDSNAPNPSYTYPAPGVYTVTHKVSNGCGDLEETSQTLTIACVDISNFPCPCTAANTINIDASVERRYSILENWFNFDKNDDGILDATDHNGCIAIKGQLDVDEDLQIVGADDIRMQGCKASINVKPERHLTMRENEHIGSCQEMWKGITSEERAWVTFTGNRILDAEYALTVHPSDILSPFGAQSRMDVEGNTFTNNHVGLRLGSPLDLLWSGGIQQTPLINNAFLTQGGLLATCGGATEGYDADLGYAGVLSKGVYTEVGVWGGPANTAFDNLRNGVVASSVFLDVRNCAFTNMVGDLGSTNGSGIYAEGSSAYVVHNNFSNCTRGVYDISNVYNNIVQNRMTGVQEGVRSIFPLSCHVVDNQNGSWEQGIDFAVHGVYASDLRVAPLFTDHKVYNNAFATTSDAVGTAIGIRLENIVPVEMPTGTFVSLNNLQVGQGILGGIQLSKQRNWDLTGNLIHLNTGGSGQWGLSLENSGSNRLNNNQIYGGASDLSQGFITRSSTGNRFCCNLTDGSSTGYSFVNICAGTRWRQSNMSNHTLGLECEVLTRISDQPINVVEQPGQPDIRKTNSNRFLSGAGGAIHKGSFDQISDSEIYVPTFVAPHYPPAGATPATDWFKESTELFVECEADEICPPYAPLATAPVEEGPIDTDYSLSARDFSKTAFDDLFEWEGGRDLYARLEQNPGWAAQSPALANFHALAANGPLAAFHAADDAVAFAQVVPNAWGEAMRDARLQIEANDAQVAAIQESALAENDPAARLALFWQAAAKRQEADSARLTLLQYQRAIDSLQRARALAALPTVAALPSADLFQSNRKTVLRVYLETLANGQRQLSPSQLAEISPIAHQCPAEGGTAVFIARSLYHRHEDVVFDDGLLCQGLEERSQRLPLAADAPSVAPNPASEMLEVLWPGSREGGVAWVSLHRASGEVVWEREAVFHQNRATLDVSSLPSGLYFCVVHTATQRFAPIKLTIIR